jgi:cytochrome bd-type quinol oxidase subunit 2
VTAVDIVRDLLVVIHLVGMASLLGGALVQMGAKDRIVNKAMEHGAGTQLVSGVLLVGTAYAAGNGDDVDNAKIGVKALVALVVFVLCMANRKRSTIRERVFFSIFVLTLVNVIVAVLWS